MAVSEDQVREALKEVVDPELFVNIIDLGLVYEVFIEDADAAPTAEAGETPPPEETAEPQAATEPATEPAAEAASEPAPEEASEPVAEAAEPAAGSCKVKIEMTLTSPACPAGPQLIAQAKDVLSRISGVSDSEIKLVMSPPWTPDRMTEDAKDQLGIM